MRRASTSGNATPRSQELTAAAPGYWPQAKSVTIKPVETAVLEYALQPECEPAKVVGTVVNAQTQAPIEGAQISAPLTRWPFTDALGRFEIPSIKPSTGNNPRQVQLTASAPGFFAQTKEITIFCGARITVDFGSRTTRPGRSSAPWSAPIPGSRYPERRLEADFGATATAANRPLSDRKRAPRRPGRRPPVARARAAGGLQAQARDVVVKGDQEVRLDFAFASANQGPVASGQSVSLDEDADLAITVAGSDPDGDALAYHVLRWPQHGTLSGRRRPSARRRTTTTTAPTGSSSRRRRRDAVWARDRRDPGRSGQRRTGRGR